jgi:hypothetical protein
MKSMSKDKIEFFLFLRFAKLINRESGQLILVQPIPIEQDKRIGDLKVMFGTLFILLIPLTIIKETRLSNIIIVELTVGETFSQLF